MVDVAHPPLTTGSLARAMLDAVDGIGGALAMPSATQSVDVIDAANAAGLTVVNVTSASELQPFALATFARALSGPTSPTTIPQFGVFDVPPRLAVWLRAQTVESIVRLTADAPVLMLIPEPSELDLVARDLLPRLVRDTSGIPVVWVLGPAEPHVTEPADDVRDVRDFSPTQLSLLNLIANSPVALSVDDLAGLAGAVTSDVARSTERLVDDRVLVTFRDRHALTSSTLRARIVERTPPTVRRSLHRVVLDVAIRLGAPAPAVAELALSCARPGDVTVADVLEAAMDALSTSNPDAAAEYGSAAIELLIERDDAPFALAWRLLPLLWQTSRVAAARDLAARAFSESGQTDAEARTLLWLARFEGSAERAVRFTESALGLRDLPTDVRVQLLAVHIRLLSTLGRADDVDMLLPDALREAALGGDDQSLSRLQTCDSIRHFYLGAYGTSARLAELAAESWARSGSSRAEWMPEIIWEPHLRALLGNPREALARIDLLLGEFADRTQSFAVRFLHAERSLILLAMGRLAEASDEVVVATTASEQLWSLTPDGSDRLQAIAVSVRLKVALHRGDAGEFEELRRMLASRAAPAGSEARHRLDWWRFLVDEAQGVTDFGVDPDQIGAVSWLDPSDEVLLARALIGSGRRASAVALAARATHRVATSDAHPLALAIASHLHGLVEADPGALEVASRGWTGLGRALLSASARSDAGATWIELGDPRGAGLQEQAHDEFAALGAHREAWRIRSALRRTGHVLGAEREGAVGALTPTERRVVDRAVLGFTVARIATELSLSPHTVTTHLRHVYTKLGLNSRAELTAWAEARIS